MSYRYEKETGDIVIDGFEKGIAPSPHLGMANMKCVNIYTEAKEVMASYQRALANQSPISGGTFNTVTSNYVSYTGTPYLNTGWVQVTASTITNLGTGYYWMNPTGAGATQYYPGTFYLDPTQSFSLGTTGTATFSTVNMAAPIQNQACIENYTDSSGVAQARYYVGDVNGHVWCYDTGQIGGSFNNLGWSLIGNQTEVSSAAGGFSGLAYFNGTLFSFQNYSIGVKMTTRLDASWTDFSGGLNTSTNHFAFVNHNGYIFYCDGDFIGQILPSSVSSAGNANLASYGTFTSDIASPSNLTFKLLGGNTPIVNQVVFFWTSNGGSLTNLTSATSGTSLSANPTVYFVGSVNLNSRTFTVSTTVNNANPVNSISVSGTGYFGTPTWPTTNTKNNTSISKEAAQLGTSDTAQCLTELGSNLIIGCQSNLIYNWNEIAIAAGGSINVVQLPENNVSSLVQANNVAYAFVGSKGNVYATNGSFVSLAMTVPDYTAGTPGTPSSYIEPYYTWGGTAFMRGRIWFSIQDQTASKTGYDGGIWSFVPSFFDPITGADAGMALRLENQNSYGTYNGMANIILPFVSQAGNGPQFYSAWTSDQSSGSAKYGIDTVSTNPYTGGQSIIETDLIPTGTFLNKKTFKQIEYTLSAPLASGESVAISYRLDSTSAFTSCGTLNTETSQSLSGYYPVNFEKGQWLQLQIVLTSTATNPSFVRLCNIRVR
jgi:hypothetical protein